MSRGPTLNEVWRERQRALAVPEAPHAEQTRHGGYDPNQPRAPAGHPDGGQWTATWPDELRQALGEAESLQSSLMSDQVLSDESPDVPRVWSQYAEAAIGHNSRNPAVERTRATLETVLNKVNGIVARATRSNPVSARLYGILVHAAFARAVRDLDLPGIGQKGVEQSFDWKGLARYGLDGSIRTDVVLRNRAGNIIAIFDVKTGDATMAPAREATIREFTGVYADVPVIIMRARRGADLW